MATIYDMATGTIIADEQDATAVRTTDNTAAPGLALQTVEHSTPIEDMPPQDAYMGRLQELLKKL
jgi:hypothetical protein